MSKKVAGAPKCVTYGKYEMAKDAQMDAVLKTQLISSELPVETIQLLKDELVKLDKNANPGYYEFVVGQISYLEAVNGDHREALNVLTSKLTTFNSLKTIYLYCDLLIQLQKDNVLNKVAEKLIKCFKHYPAESNLLERHYLALLLDKIYPFCAELAFDELETLFGSNHNLVISAVSHFKFKYNPQISTDLQNYIIKVNQKYAKSAFPKATDINNDIEYFVVTVCKNHELYVILPSKIINEIVTGSFTKTFQNLKILKQHIVLQTKHGHLDEIEPAYNVYIEYVEKSKAQHNNEYLDLLDTIDLVSKVLIKVVSSDNPARVLFVEHLSTKLQHLLEILSDDLDIQYNNEGTGFPEGRLKLLPSLAALLSSSWFVMALAHKFLAKYRSTTVSELDLNLSNCEVFFQNCLSSNQIIIPEHYFEFALIEAKLNKLKNAIKLMKLCCFHDKENFKYWNFLTLLYSTEENYKNSESLINNSILLLNSKMEEDLYVSRLSLVQKYEILQLKMTQISLVELVNKDTSVALECLPELFLLFNRLFETFQQIENGYTLSRTSTSKSKKANPLKKILTRQSVSLLKKTAMTKQLPPLSKASDDTLKISQELWLWSLNLFVKAKMYDEAENCIVEAENSYKITSMSRSKFGLLLSETNRLKLALQEFESAIQLDEHNLEAVLGMSKLILQTPNNDEIFINEKDKQAAHLRLRLLLEKFQHTYTHCQTTEVHWYLSQLYELYQDLDECQSCLWKCVELEESKPVRDFQCLERKY